MMDQNRRRRILHSLGCLSACLLLIGVIAFLIVGIRDAQRADRLRSEICKLELGKSTFAEVSRIFPQYKGYVRSHDDVPPSCSPEGCFYVLYVEPNFKADSYSSANGFVCHSANFRKHLKGKVSKHR